MHLPKILQLNKAYDTIIELNKISGGGGGDRKKGKEFPYMLPLITVDL